MAGIHFETEFETLGGDEWSAVVWDKDVTTAPNYNMKLSAAPVVEYQGNESLVPMFNVMHSNASVGFLIQSASDLVYINDIIDGAENQFYLILKKGENIFWRGIIRQDGLKIDRRSYPFEVVLNANDGLARLSDVKISLGVTPFVNLIEMFDKILGETLITNADWDVTEPMISTVCRWYETDMFDPYVKTTDPLRYSKIYNALRLYKRTSNDGVVSYESYMKALTDQLVAWGLCVKQHNGHWHIFQVDAYQESTMKIHTYTNGIAFNGNATAVTSGTAGSSNYVHAESIANSGEIKFGEFYSFAPIMRESKVVVVNLENKDVLPLSYFTNLQALTTLDEVVTGNFSTGVLIRLNLTADISATTWPTNFLLEWQITIKCGTNYFTNQGGANRWTTTNTDFFSVQQILGDPGQSRAFFPLNNAVGGSFYNIITTDIPANDDLDIQVKPRLLSLPGNALTGLTVHDVAGTIGVEYFNYNAYTAPNDRLEHRFGTNADSSFVFDLGETQIADDPDTVFGGKLMISNGTAFQDSTEWKRFAVGATSRSITDTLLDFLFSKQQRPLHILTATIINPGIEVIGTITVDSRGLYMQRGKYNIGMDEWSGSWIELKEYAENDGSSSEIPLDIGLGLPVNTNGTNGLVDPAWRMNNGFLRITETSEIITGTMTDFDVVDPGVNVANVDDELLVVNPYNGQTETVVLSASFENGATNVEIDSHVFVYDFPVGSIVAIPLKNVAARLFSLENP